MKLQELTGVKGVMENNTLQQFLNNLKTTKNMSVRNGQFSIVVVPPDGDKVYKMWAIDSAWEHFVKVCQVNAGLSFLPKFGKKIYEFKNGFIRRSDITTNIKAVSIEKLTPLPDEWLTQEIYESIFEPLFHILSRGDDYISIINKVKTIDPKMAIFLDKSITFLQRNLSDYKFDIHAKNIMMRGDNYVMADPFYDVSDFNNQYRLPLSMDSYNFLPQKTELNYNSPHYISGSRNTVVVAKNIAANNISVWEDIDSIKRYNLSSSDFPNTILSSNDNMDRIIDAYVANGNILPMVITNAILINSEISIMYSKKLASAKLSDSYFFMNITNIKTNKPNDFYILCDNGHKVLSYEDNHQFANMIFTWIVQDAVHNEIKIALLLPSLISMFYDDSSIIDNLYHELLDAVDMTDTSWIIFSEKVVWNKKTPKKIKDLFE